VSLFAVSVIGFAITHVLPGNPVYLLLGPRADQHSVEVLTQQLGLNRPLPEQYVRYVTGIAHGDFGTSLRTGSAVSTDLAARWPASLELALVGGLLALVWGMTVGIMAAVKRGTYWERLASVVSGLGVSVPEFWLGLILILIFYSMLKIAPAPIGRLPADAIAPAKLTGMYLIDSLASGEWAVFAGAAGQLALPAITLAFVGGAPIARISRAAMREALDSQYVRFATALGVRRSAVVARYALPSVLVPVTTMMALLCGYLMGGDVLVEYVFAWPGLGKYAVDSIGASDYAPVMAVVELSAVTYLVIYLLMDLLHMAIDSRTRG
jgi:peptide/nickel transport system permease protein